ncbi:MAG TPA: carboxylesterase family protein [Silvibacterium sp.]|nr:carboxylesterase family protein [Silvibacterium sp.]
MKRFAALAIAVGVCTSLSANTAQPKDDHPVVMTVSGAVSGVIDSATQVRSFKGLPFAAPPVGELRWRPPAPAERWSGVRDGSKFGASCMQQVHGDFLPWTKEFLVKGEVSENCLYLNVWTPPAKENANLPVIVYIPGGGFVEGSGSTAIYDGTNLASTGVVVVTINYRLGPFGFLAHPELTAESPHHSSGNYALLDQIAALQWVKENIGGFGGDPHKVTIWGQSAGAFSVGDLLVSPQARGLFQAAVADSGLGVAGFPSLDLPSAEKNGVKFAEAHHASSIKELRAIPAQKLLAGAQDHTLLFFPIVDGWVMPEAPNALNQGAGGNDVPVITGNQANDGMLFSPTIRSSEDFDRFVDRMYRAMGNEFERLYPGGSFEQMHRSLIESARDRERVSAFLWAEQRLQHHRGPVYTYFFDQAVPWPQHPEFGAFHSGELPYFFRNLNVMDRPWEPVDREVSQTTSAYLKNFAGSGNPNGPGLPEWSAVNPALPETMEMGAKMQPMPLADKAKYDFWVRYFHSPAGRNAPPF